MSTHGISADNLRLEIERPLETGELPNLIQNPNGELGAWGWITPVANTRMESSFSTSTGYRLDFKNDVTQAAHFTSEFLPLAAGRWVGGRWDIVGYSTNVTMKGRFEFYDTNKVLISSSVQTAAYGDGTGPGTYYLAGIQAPTGTVWVKVRFDVYSSGGNMLGGTQITFQKGMVTHAATASELGTTRTNLVSNPSFETNVTGWVASRPAMTVSRTTTQFVVGVASMQIQNTPAGTYTTMPAQTTTGTGGIPVTGGSYYSVQAQFRSPNSRTAQVGITWWKADGTGITTHYTSTTLTANTWKLHSGTFTAPSDAAYASAYVAIYHPTGTLAANEAAFVDAVMLEKASTVGAYIEGTVASGNYAFADPIQWRDVLGPTHKIDVNRGALDVGTLTATILDSTLDPSESAIVRPGKRVRLQALSGTTWETLFYGKADKATVVYHHDRDDLKKARIELTAFDPTSDLANLAEPRGVAKISELPYILEGKGVPWKVNGSGNQVTSATVVAYNENASVLDQVAITRDSELGKALVSRNGVLVAQEPIVYIDPPQPVATFRDAAYAETVKAGSAVGYWRLGETSGTVAADASGNGRNGTYVGSPTLGVAGALVGDSNTAARFNGTAAQHVTSANFPSYAAEFSAEAWVYLDADGVATQAILEKSVGDSTNSDWLLFYEANTFAWRVVSDTSTLSTIYSAVPTRSAWHHVAGTVSGNTIRLYLDGVEVASAACTRTVAKSSGNLWMGRLASATAYALKGVLDEPAVYDRALTPAEIADHYKTGAARVLSYSDIDVSYDTRDAINEVNLKFLRYNPVTLETEEVPYGPYRNQSSISEWGPRTATFTVQGIAEQTTPLSDYASAILSRNSVPKVRANSLRFPVRSTADIATALLDHDELVRVKWDKARKSADLRITGIHHLIDSEGVVTGVRWLMDLEFTTDNAVAAPQLTPSPQTGGEGKTIGELLRPAGEVTMWATDTAPTGWLLANGQSVSTTTYKRLFDVIGYAYGGSGAAFNVPNFNDRFPIGAGVKATGTAGGSATKTLTAANMPEHSHTLKFSDTTGGNMGNVPRGTATNNGTSSGAVNTNGSGTAFDVMNPWRAIQFIIKT